MTKVCLINPPDLHSLDPKLDASLGLMYLSSTLKKGGHQVEILDLAFYDKSQWLSTIAKHPADLFGLTVYSVSVYESDIISKLIKSVFPASKIVWGGPHPTFCAPEVIAEFPEVDFIIFGEGEGTLLELCDKFSKPFQYGSIAGLGNRNGKFFFMSNQRGLIKDIDCIPPPDREALPLKSYTRKVFDLPSTPLMTSRGCAYQCRFCVSHDFWNHPRFHSLERVKLELNQIKNMGFEAYHCWDDTFTLNPKRNEITTSYCLHYT